MISSDNPYLSNDPRFDGKTFSRDQDGQRLWTALAAVEDLLSDGEWRTLRDICAALRANYGIVSSEAGISARFRDLRKERFGGYSMKSRRVAGGLWEYQMAPSFRLEFSP